jgi:hypothetical protein
MMGLKFKPLTVSEHRNRWSAALVKVWEYGIPLDSIADHLGDRPGQHREHLFDFHDGIRLIVSADKYGDGTYLHVSVSVSTESEAEKAIKLESGRCCLQKLDVLVNERVRGMGGPPLTACVVVEEIVHFYHPALKV